MISTDTSLSRVTPSAKQIWSRASKSCASPNEPRHHCILYGSTWIGLSARFAPAVSEARIVLDLFERRIEGAELAADALNGGAYVGPVAVRPLAGDETFMAQAVVD